MPVLSRFHAAFVVGMALGAALPAAVLAQGEVLQFGMSQAQVMRAAGTFSNVARRGTVVEAEVRGIRVGGIPFNRQVRFENNRLVGVMLHRFQSRISQSGCAAMIDRAGAAVSRRRAEAARRSPDRLTFRYRTADGGSVAVRMGYTDVLRATRRLWQRERPDDPFPHGQSGTCSLRITYDFRR